MLTSRAVWTHRDRPTEPAVGGTRAEYSGTLPSAGDPLGSPAPLGVSEGAGVGHYGCAMSPKRLEAFSDGVIAIIITIMVLELRSPHGPDLAALLPLLPMLSSYVLSFIFVGIYWNNHHHMLRTTSSGSTAGCCGRTCTCCSGSRSCRSSRVARREPGPVPSGAVYGGVLMMCALQLLRDDQGDAADPSTGRAARGRAWVSDRKGKLSLAMYTGGAARCRSCRRGSGSG